MCDGLMDHFCLFNKAFSKLEIEEADHYTKLIHLEMVRLFQERLEENNIPAAIPADLLMPKEMDVRLAVVYAHRKLTKQINDAKNALPWSISRDEYGDDEDVAENNEKKAKRKKAA